MHVGGVEIVLFIPCRGRQNDVGINAGRGHAEIERDQKVEFSFRGLVVPHGFACFLCAFSPQILAKQAVRRAEQVFQEIFVSLARRTEQVGAPDKHIARPVGLVIRVLAGQGDGAVLQRIRYEILRFLPGRGCFLCDFQRIGLELRRGR